MGFPMVFPTENHGQATPRPSPPAPPAAGVGHHRPAPVSSLRRYPARFHPSCECTNRPNQRIPIPTCVPGEKTVWKTREDLEECCWISLEIRMMVCYNVLYVLWCTIQYMLCEDWEIYGNIMKILRSGIDLKSLFGDALVNAQKLPHPFILGPQPTCLPHLRMYCISLTTVYCSNIPFQSVYQDPISPSSEVITSYHKSSLKKRA